MTPTQQAALEALAGRALTAGEVEQITPLIEVNHQAIADILSVGRKVVRSRMTSARGVAEFYAGGPIGAEIVLMKLEGARDAMLSSQDQQQQVLGSLLRRQLGFLAGEGLDFGSAALRGMLDQFAAMSVLTAEEVAALKAIAEFPETIPHQAVTTALRG